MLLNFTIPMIPIEMLQFQAKTVQNGYLNTSKIFFNILIQNTFKYKYKITQAYYKLIFFKTGFSSKMQFSVFLIISHPEMMKSMK